MENKPAASKHYYLLDASAYCRFVENISNPQSQIAHNIFSKSLEGYFYYMPQFCITEVFNTFAKWHYAQKSINYQEYIKITDFFKLLIRNRNVFYPYDLHRYHNLNCDKIFPIEHTTPRGKQVKLSTFDILIIAMALELQIIHGNDNLTILSCDVRLMEIAKRLKIKTELYC